MKETQKVKLRFYPDGRNGELIAFVGAERDLKLFQVEVNEKVRKSIVLIDRGVKDILRGVLYNVEVYEMRSGRGFIAVSASPVQYITYVEKFHVPKAVYQVVATFGNQRIVYDPVDGKTQSTTNLNRVVKYLDSRHDIYEKENVITKFRQLARELYASIRKEGLFLR